MLKLNKRNKGFTLIEILIVVIVIGILIGMAIPYIGGIRKAAADNVDKANLDTLQTLTEAYRLLHTSYPAGSDANTAQQALVNDKLLKAKITPPGTGSVVYTYSSGTWSSTGSN